MIEIRHIKIMVGKCGNGGANYRLQIPLKWIKELGITEDDRNVRATLENGKIIIEKVN